MYILSREGMKRVSGPVSDPVITISSERTLFHCWAPTVGTGALQAHDTAIHSFTDRKDVLLRTSSEFLMNSTVAPGGFHL